MLGKGLSKSIKKLIVALYDGEPLRGNQMAFCEQMKQDLKAKKELENQ